METEFIIGGKDEKKVKNTKSTFDVFISDIVDELEKRLVDGTVLPRLLNGIDTLERVDIKNNSQPEDFTEKCIIEPLLKYLGYSVHAHKSGSGSKTNKKEVDYIVESKSGNNILVESEPINKNLYQKEVGVKQMETYLELKSFRADIGIVTNGFTWILLKYDCQDYTIKILETIELRYFFVEELNKRRGQRQIVQSQDKQVERFIRTFSKKTIDSTVIERAAIIKERKRDISRQFYDDYIRYVFGVNGKNNKEYCLLDTISGGGATPQEEKRLFAVTLMNRLIFIRFLEDRSLVPKNLLNKLLEEYRGIKSSPNSFYTTYLKPLFYGVLNTHPRERSERIRSVDLFKGIPYLNGGLFRNVTTVEQQLDVSDDILVKVIMELMEKYRFTLKSDNESLDPDVLGNVFEKTINFLTKGQKESGAYYTGEEITSFISKKTIQPYLLAEFKNILKQYNWKDSEIDYYTTLDSMLAALPNLPAINKSFLQRMDAITILDPACGSGHFLTSALSEIIHVRKAISDALGENCNVFDIKKSTISKNIYGVDLEGSAVEIAKLRLWLSLIESIDIDNPEDIDTLPNIEYNILSGNSLVGWFKDEDKSQNIFQFNFESNNINSALKKLEIAYGGMPESLGTVSLASNLISETEYIDLHSIRKAYVLLRGLYSTEKGEKAEFLRNILEEIRSEIYKIITPQVWRILSSNSKKIDWKLIKDSNFEKCFHWGVDFGNVIDTGGFDIVIGNPPYGVQFEKWESDFIKKTTNFARTHMVSEVAFIEKSYQLVKDGGYLGLIIPKNIMYSHMNYTCREAIISDLVLVSDVSVSFAKVKLEQVIIVLNKNKPTTAYKIASPFNDIVTDYDKEVCKLTKSIVLDSNENHKKLLMKLLSSDYRLGQATKSTMGVHMNSKAISKSTSKPILCGKNVGAFVIRKNPELFLPDELISKEFEQFLKPKIVIQVIITHITKPKPHLKLMAAYDEKGRILVDTLCMIEAIKEDKWSKEFLLCALNSKLISWYAYHYIYSDAIRTMHAVAAYTDRFPLPSGDIDNSFFKSIVSIIDTSSRVVSRGKEEIRNNILDEMNNAIYKAYGLTDDEIALIEENYLVNGDASQTSLDEIETEVEDTFQ